MNKPLISTFFLSLFLLLSSGCVGIDDLSREDYRKGVLYTSNLSGETFAVMPMIGRGPSRNYTKTAESIFYRSLTEMRQGGQLISPAEGRERIEAGKLSPALERFQKETSSNKVIAEGDLSKLTGVLGARFLLQTELQQVEITEGATQVRIQGKLWDTEMGDVVWEGIGESRGYLFLFFPRVPTTFEKAVEVASRGLIKRLP